jgi:Tol biopolymer transport system component
VRALEQVDSFSVSPRGNRAAYAVVSDDPNIWQLSLSSPDQMTGSPSPLVELTKLDHSPAWAPNGRKIAFTSTAGGRPEIWVCDADGSNAGRVSGGVGAFPAWSPDSQRIVFESKNERNERILTIIRADGGSPRRLATGRNEVANLWPNWSHDGRWIYFRSMSGKDSNIWKISINGGSVSQVTQDGGDIPQESPDGTMLYFQKADEYPKRCSVWRLPAAGGPETRVLDDVYCYGGWAVAKSGIYYVRLRDSEGLWEIRLRDFETGLTQVITKFDRWLSMRLALNPENFRLLFVQHDYAGSDLMLVEDFH